MLNEEECEKALKSLTFAVIRNYSNTKFDFVSRKQILKSRYQRQHDMIEKLIKEHFEFLEVLKECGLGELTPADLRVVIKAGQYNAKQLNELRNPKPLKFEELKPNMWVWDNGYKEWCYIYFIAGKYPHRKYIDNCESDGIFEENRFYRKQVEE